MGSDAKVHTNGAVQLGVTVTGGGGTQPATVTLSFIDEGRLQAVGPPGYAYTWDTTTANEGSHRVKATVVGGTSGERGASEALDARVREVGPVSLDSLPVAGAEARIRERPVRRRLEVGCRTG